MSPLKHPFHATIESSLKALGELVAVLRKEQEALTATDPEVLERFVARKLELLKDLEHSVKAREQILSQAGSGSGLAGSEHFIREHFAPEEIIDQWRQLQEFSKAADQLNTENAKLAFAGEHTTRQALSILTGRPQEPGTYTKRRSRNADNGRSGLSLGKC